MFGLTCKFGKYYLELQVNLSKQSKLGLSRENIVKFQQKIPKHLGFRQPIKIIYKCIK